MLAEATATAFDTTGGGLNVPRRKLAIVGSHPATRELAPYEDPDYEIWLFNEAPLKPEVYRRWDACLQIHGPEVYARPNNWVNMGYWEWLQQPHGKPIFMQDVDPRVPDSVRYPLEGVLALIPYHYLRSSPALALALAIYLGYPTIEVYGSELSSNTEYGYQATNFAFWIGFAHGRGIDLRLRCWEGEFNQRIYGFEGELQLSPEFFEYRVFENKPIERQNARRLAELEREISDAMLQGKAQRVAALSIEAENVAMAAGEAFGIVSEANRYLSKEQMISRQEFERVQAQALQDGDELRSQKDHAGGKLEYVWNVWKLTGRHDALEQVRAFLKDKLDLSYKTGEQHGIYLENLYYMNQYDERLTAAGGARALGRVEDVEKIRR